MIWRRPVFRRRLLTSIFISDTSTKPQRNRHRRILGRNFIPPHERHLPARRRSRLWLELTVNYDETGNIMSYSQASLFQGIVQSQDRNCWEPWWLAEGLRPDSTQNLTTTHCWVVDVRQLQLIISVGDLERWHINEDGPLSMSFTRGFNSRLPCNKSTRSVGYMQYCQ